MFNFNRKETDEAVYSPCIGLSLPLAQVKDEVFSKKMIGEGIAFQFKDSTVYSPCDGKIIMIAPTKHAFGIRSKAGTEILVHIGLETAEFNGHDFDVLVKEGQNVKAHTPIIRINTESLTKKKVDMTTPLIVTNVDISNVLVMSEETVNLNTVVCRIKRGKRRIR